MKQPKTAQTNRMLGLPRRFSFSIWKVVLVLFALAASNVFAAPPDELPAGFPEIQLPAKAHGEGAIRALGNQLPAVAAFYKTTAKDLQNLLRRDKSLWVDTRGRLFYICEFGVAPDAVTSLDPKIEPKAPFPYADTFLLHSRPGATKLIYLDFDGHDGSATSWGSSAIARPFDMDGNPASFSNTERDLIQGAWQRVAEDFAMYDVDVTTEDPGMEALRKLNTGDVNYGIRVVIGGAGGDWYGSAGGVAYIGSFDWNSDTPCWVFPKSLGPNNQKYVAEAISHEAGHTFGLNHDGQDNGGTHVEYYGGHGNWAPIMGVGYYEPITQWSRGQYIYANNAQDDLTVMLGEGISYRADDFGNTTATASPILGTSFTVSGVIERTNDVDFFSFQTGAGPITLIAMPAPVGPNLHILLSLYDGTGNLIISNNSVDTGSGVVSVSISTNLPTGTYYFSIDGLGVDDPLTNGYSDYGSLGQYTVSGTVPASSSWVPAAPGNYSWTTTANWASGMIPDAANAIANINNNLVGDQTINLDIPITIGRLVLGDADGSHAFTLANGSGGSLNFQSTTNSASLQKTNGASDIIAASAVLKANLAVVNTSAADLNFTGVVSGSGGLTKSGLGKVVLGGMNTYTGNTTVSSGTLAFGIAGSISQSAVINVQSGAGLDVAAVPSGFVLNSNQMFSGSGFVAGDFTAGLASQLVPGNIPGAGTITFSNNLALTGGGKILFDLASTQTPGGGTNDLIVVNGNLALGATTTVDFNFLNSAPASPGAYTLIRYSGSLVGSAANLVATNSDRYVFTFDDSTPGEIRVHVSGIPTGLIWNGDGTTNRWDIAGSTNWLSGGIPERFFQLDAVTFDDAGSNSPAINLVGSLSPAGVTVNSSNSYTFSGSGKIGGGTSLTKLGAGTLTLNTSNDYTGATLVSEGTLKAGNSSALGSTNSGTTISAGARLDLNAFSLGAESVTVAGTGVGGSGAIINSSATTQSNALRFVTLSGDSTFGGMGRWDVRANPTASFTGNNFNLTKTGTNEIWLVGVGASGLGNIIIDQGALGFRGTSTMGNTTNTVTVASNAVLAISATDNNVLSKKLVMNGGATVRSEIGDNLFSGTIAMEGTNTFTNAAGLELQGVISGGGSLTKKGVGTLSLAANNSYTGTTFVQEGTLLARNSGALGSTSGGTIITAGGRLDVNAQNLGAEPISVTGTGLGSAGAIISTSDTAQSNALRFVTLTGNTTIGGNGSWDIRANPTGAFTGNNFNLTKVGPGLVRLADVGPTGLGNITISAGTLGVQTNTTLGNAASNLTVSSTATFEIYSTDTNALNKVLVVNSGTVRNVRGTNIFLGPITLTGAPIFWIDSPTFISPNYLTNVLIVSNSVSGSGGLALATGLGYLVLAGTNSYSGGTSIQQGILQIGNGGSTGTLGQGTVTNSYQLLFNRSDDFAVTNVISGTSPAGSEIGIFKKGAGTLTLSGPNTYPGPITNLAGTLRVGNASALGTTSAGTSISGGAALDINGFNLGAENIFLQANAEAVNNGADQTSALRYLTLLGNATVGGNGRWDVRDPGVGGASSVTGNGFNLTKTGSNQVWLANVGATGLGDITVSNGLFGVEGTTTLGSVGKTLALRAGSTFAVLNSGANILNKLLTMNAASIRNAGGTNSFQGNAIITGANTFDVVANSQLTMSSTISSSGSLTKIGSGILNLISNNTYTGTTVINGGTLVLSGAGSIGSSLSIEVDAGAIFDASAIGGFVLNSGKTLLGNGIINGNATINGFLSPGISIGRLVFNNAVTLAGTNVMELSRNGSTVTNDSISVGGNLFCGGALVVTNIGGALMDGDSFQLFSSASISGAFARVNLLSLNPGLHWNTNQLLTAGSIRVEAIPPQILPASEVGTNLLVNVQTELGLTYILQTTTELNPPPSWLNLSTNAGSGGVLSIPIPIYKDEMQRVFRFLVY